MSDIDYQTAIDVLREQAAKELAQGYHAHYNALIYAANMLENKQALGKETQREP
ncbi:hypothetical protein GKA92_16885 [Salmonella enterica subsp. enterica]|nr:hypothetical protein [Salmonella enterica subsp. enterica serovar Abaetetuba]